MMTEFFKIPLILFFFLAILIHVTIQIKISFQLHDNFDKIYTGIVDLPLTVPENHGIANGSSHFEENINNIKKTIEPIDKNNFINEDTITESSNIIIQDLNLTIQNQLMKVDTILSASSKKRNTSTEHAKMKKKPRAFFGIMTYDSKDEQKRRDLIRKTYLNYFVDHINRTLVGDEEYNEKKHWICSLQDLDTGRLEHPEKCRLAYAFVMGANPNGTTMLLNFNESYPLSLPPPSLNESKISQKDVLDSVFLNIQENGKFGKSPTWFRYAIDVVERHGWRNSWDYIFKSDTDNLIYTPNFFRFMDTLPLKHAVRVFGGRPLDYKGCGGDFHDHCKQMVGPVFMAGGCYFLSLDLAKFISDETTFNHEAVKLPHEDMTTGNFVFSHPKNIRIVKEPRHKGVIRTHPVKKDRKYKFRWKKMLREENDRLTSRLAHVRNIEEIDALE